MVELDIDTRITIVASQCTPDVQVPERGHDEPVMRHQTDRPLCNRLKRVNGCSGRRHGGSIDSAANDGCEPGAESSKPVLEPIPAVTVLADLTGRHGC